MGARNPGPRLLDAVRRSKMVLAVIGRAWDDSRNIERLRSENDWVRRKLLVALENRVPIVAVLVDRSDIPAFDVWESFLGARQG